jgi:putative phage-type endonuclease
MSFGELNNIINDCCSLITTNITFNTVNKDDLINLKNQVYKELLPIYNSLTINMLDEIFSKLFTPKYKFNQDICFDGGNNCLREYECIYDDIKVKSKYQKLEDQFQKLLKMPQPAQRTKEWYDYRYNRITASDTASAIDQNPYEPVEGFILKKCDPNFPFRDNDAVCHGKKYEPIATMIYEHIYNCRMFEFGALPSEKYNFLGASPDGICSKYTLDNKFCKRIGRMLEIKCPVSRDIHTKGKIIGDICPFYYYCQIQQQLVCCELELCDFWQCRITEYKNKQEYLLDTCLSTINAEGIEGNKVDINPKLKKGMILEFYPKVFNPIDDDDKIEWKSKFIIPKSLDLSVDQYNDWVLTNIDQYKNLYPELAKDYYFNRIIYWKLEVSHNVTIERDDIFFESLLPVLKDTWAKVQYYRKNKDKLSEIRTIADKRKKYVKMNLTYTIANKKILETKYDFLKDGFDHNLLLTDKVVSKSSYYKKVYNNSNSDNNVSDNNVSDNIIDNINMTNYRFID